jgi:hypothetical protein
MKRRWVSLEDFVERRRRTRSLAPLPTSDERHGTYHGYRYWGCRCEGCCGAYRDYNRKAQKRRVEYTQEHGLPPGASHGYSAYRNWGCRCAVCCEDAALKNKKRSTKK